MIFVIGGRNGVAHKFYFTLLLLYRLPKLHEGDLFFLNISRCGDGWVMNIIAWWRLRKIIKKHGSHVHFGD